MITHEHTPTEADLAVERHRNRRLKRSNNASWLTLSLVLAFACMQTYRLNEQKADNARLQGAVTTFERSIESFAQNANAQNVQANAMWFKFRTEEQRAGSYEAGMLTAQTENARLSRLLAQCRSRLDERTRALPYSPSFLDQIDAGYAP